MQDGSPEGRDGGNAETRFTTADPTGARPNLALPKLTFWTAEGRSDARDAPTYPTQNFELPDY